jgi:pyruvate formate lyase activating enzyme
MGDIFIGGLQKQSFIDYPGEVSCVIFLAGCNMRCHYCHNSQLFNSAENKIPFNEVLQYIEKNKKMLSAAVISGGEPTTHPHLFDIIRQIKTISDNIKIKLDTNGTRPDTVKSLVAEKLVDFIAMDIKAPIEKYEDVTGIKFSHDIYETAEYLKMNNVEYMFRTTISPKLTEQDIHSIGNTIIKGAAIWQIQQYSPNEYSNSFDMVLLPYQPEKIQKFGEIAENYAQHIVVRGI